MRRNPITEKQAERERKMNLTSAKAYYANNTEKCIAASKRWFAKNREKFLPRERARRRFRRLAVIRWLGGICVCCGEDRPNFLVIDHKNGGGNKQRKTVPITTLQRLLFQRKLSFDGYQILCHNCNSAKGYYGFCQHVGEWALCS